MGFQPQPPLKRPPAALMLQGGCRAAPGQMEVPGTMQGCGAPRWPAWEQLLASVLGCRVLNCEPLLFKGAREF